MDPPCPTSEVSCWSGGVRVGRRRLSSGQAHAPARRSGRVSFRRDPSDGQVSAMVDFAIPLPRRGAGAFIVSVVSPSYLITLLPLRFIMSSYLSTMPLVLVVRRAFADKECRPYLCQVGHVGRPAVRGHDDVAAKSTSVISFFPPPPEKTFSRCPIRVLEMRSYAKLLACGGVRLVPSGGSRIGWTERSFGNLNGVGADPTEREGSGT
ncbi:hypothetical protein BHM03_00030078 [Ensete ventricosum]|nr:hypothetical protein BHM03_00030078 [Ensete ventricosum]